MSSITIPNHTIPFRPSAKPETNYAPTPKGAYSGRLIRVYDCGETADTNKKTGEVTHTQKISLVFEIDYAEEGEIKNRYITMYPMRYNLFAQSNLSKLLAPWMGAEYPSEDSKTGIDWERAMDLEVTVTVDHREATKDGKTKFYDQISNLSKPPRRTPIFEGTHGQWMWSVSQDPTCQAAEELKIPKYIIDIAKTSLEAQKASQDKWEREAKEVFGGGGNKPPKYTSGEAPIGPDGRPAF